MSLKLPVNVFATHCFCTYYLKHKTVNETKNVLNKFSASLRRLSGKHGF